MADFHSRWIVRIGGPLLVLLLLALGATSARAGSYDVHACGSSAGFENNAWRASADRGMLAYTKCPARGDLRRGMVVRNKAERGTVRRGRSATMTFSAPSGARLAGLAYDWDGYRANGEWSIGLSSDDRWLAGCRARRPSLTAACRLGAPNRSEWPRFLGLNGRRSVSLEATCGRSAGCGARSTRDRATGGARAILSMSRATVRVEDFTTPRISTTRDGIFDGRWQRATRNAAFDAQDNVGIRESRLAVDGVTRAQYRSACDYTRRVPCPKLSARNSPIDTRRLTDGVHGLSLAAVDTAGNPVQIQRTVRVDNHAPGPIRDLSVRGGDKVRSTNSFDLRWTTPPGQAAPIAQAHYRLCRSGSEEPCVRGTRAVNGASLNGLSVPQRGDYRLRIWLQDEAGNVDPRTASNSVRLRFDDRTPTRIDAAILDDRGDGAEHRTVEFGERPVVTGRLADRNGSLLKGARVRVLSRPRGAASPFAEAGSATSDGSGRFEYRVRRGSSRTLRFTYGGSSRHRPATAQVRVGVRAKSTMAASRRTARNGDRVRFSGRLLGRPFPSRGKLIELQAFYRDRWRAFAVTRAGQDGQWAYDYRFGGTRGVVVYRFRAVIRREADYPYESGRSRAVKVTVHGP